MPDLSQEIDQADRRRAANLRKRRRFAQQSALARELGVQGADDIAADPDSAAAGAARSALEVAQGIAPIAASSDPAVEALRVANINRMRAGNNLSPIQGVDPGVQGARERASRVPLDAGLQSEIDAFKGERAARQAALKKAQLSGDVRSLDGISDAERIKVIEQATLNKMIEAQERTEADKTQGTRDVARTEAGASRFGSVADAVGNLGTALGGVLQQRIAGQSAEGAARIEAEGLTNQTLAQGDVDERLLRLGSELQQGQGSPEDVMEFTAMIERAIERGADVASIEAQIAVMARIDPARAELLRAALRDRSTNTPARRAAIQRQLFEQAQAGGN